MIDAAATDGDVVGPVRISSADHRFPAISDLYALETELLDDLRLTDWLDQVLSTEVRYVAPVRVTRLDHERQEFVGGMYHLDENRASLVARVGRGATGVAWAEDPPSRARRHVSSLRLFDGTASGQLMTRMNVLLTRNRFDAPTYELLSYERRDVLVEEAGGYRIREREVRCDQSCLGMVNLAIWL